MDEFVGRFDGFWSTKLYDGHEDGIAQAAIQMVGEGSAQQFLVDLINIADPLDMDYPEDAAKADGGERMNNIYKANAACEQLIGVVQC